MRYLSPFSRLNAKLDSIIERLDKMASNTQALFAQLQTAVANETSVDQSVITLVQGQAAQIQTLINNSENTVDPVALQAIVTTMTNNAAGLAAAVVANTPVATSQQNPPAAG